MVANMLKEKNAPPALSEARSEATSRRLLVIVVGDMLLSLRSSSDLTYFAGMAKLNNARPIGYDFDDNAD